MVSKSSGKPDTTATPKPQYNIRPAITPVETHTAHWYRNLARNFVFVQGFNAPPFGLLNRQRAYTWPSGDIYTGEWKDAKRNGLGIHKFADGTVLAGTWKNDKLAP